LKIFIPVSRDCKQRPLVVTVETGCSSIHGAANRCCLFARRAKGEDMLSHYRDQVPFQTRDGSEIRELMHPAVHGNRNQSLAEARVLPGQKTALHRHHQSEELYHVSAGEGLMTLGMQQFAIGPGDTLAIAPETAHCVENTGKDPLVILCCCSPAYAHRDTELL
jgi:mannose-6-phosphate isomerase-like protein (cupin superfamily)